MLMEKKVPVFGVGRRGFRVGGGRPSRPAHRCVESASPTLSARPFLLFYPFSIKFRFCFQPPFTSFFGCFMVRHGFPCCDRVLLGYTYFHWFSMSFSVLNGFWLLELNLVGYFCYFSVSIINLLPIYGCFFWFYWVIWIFFVFTGCFWIFLALFIGVYLFSLVFNEFKWSKWLLVAWV